ncbi:MAG: hypothetical protein N2747_07105 [Chitinophagaceae bacterium]|nr:hypothetical protein [Chitinophagaceae bacterium]
MKFFYLSFFFLFISRKVFVQELYVFTNPASNVPAQSVSLKISEYFVPENRMFNQYSHRLRPQVSIGLGKKWMMMAGATFANMHTLKFQYESWSLYTKYRFLSKDDAHRHFRMALFAEASSTQSPFHYDEVTLMGDKDGIETGIIATQLWHKLAVSATVSHIQLLHHSRFNDVVYVPKRNYQSGNYSLSAGYLVLPKEYKHYRQTNLNVYVEVLAQQAFDTKKYYVDLAPAVQLIFNSNTKLNIGYRFQAAGNMQRMTNFSWLISVERTFLGVFEKENRKD